MVTATISPPAVKQTRNLINGEWCEAASGKTFDALNPATGETIAAVCASETADIDQAVAAARKAFEDGPWPKTSGRDRGKMLFKLAELIAANAEELAGLEVLNNGKPVREVLAADIPLVVETFRYYAGWADKIHGETIPVDDKMGRFFCYTRREPVGVCGQIIPWNFPLLMAAWKWGPALAAGNTIVLKPAEQTPLTALRMGELALEAGFPPGVVNIVNGFGESAGEALVKHPDVDKIAFTGEYKTAQIIMANAAPTLKRLTFELGGKSPNVIFADANLRHAVGGAMAGIFFNQGEVCCAGSRVFVERKVHDDFVNAFSTAAQDRKLGDPFDPKTEQGAQVSQEQFDRVMGYIEAGKAEGANCVTGGQRHGDKGYFVEPTIFTGVNNKMKIAQEEIFGPVAAVLPFDDVEQVAEEANTTIFGLAAAVWTRDIAKAHRFAARLRAGTVWVNCYNAFDPAAPFGGYKFSGHGRENGREALDHYTETKTVWVSLR
ncbi:MAG: aldehyde dehydrogenase family protein [Planctomycetota bacterium]|jgi:aldehyde dehydrogenase (NAD+)